MGRGRRRIERSRGESLAVSAMRPRVFWPLCLVRCPSHMPVVICTHICRRPRNVTTEKKKKNEKEEREKRREQEEKMMEQDAEEDGGAPAAPVVSACLFVLVCCVKRVCACVCLLLESLLTCA